MTKQMMKKLNKFLALYLDSLGKQRINDMENLKMMFIQEVAEAAKAERDKEILNLELELSDVAGSTKKYWMQLGVDRFKALLTPNQKEV